MGQPEVRCVPSTGKAPLGRRPPRKLRRTGGITARDWGRHFRETSRLEHEQAREKVCFGSLAEIKTATTLVRLVQLTGRRFPFHPARRCLLQVGATVARELRRARAISSRSKNKACILSHTLWLPSLCRIHRGQNT